MAVTGLGPGDHLCLIYETPQERLDVLVPFLKAGLMRWERCVYVADEGGAQDVLDALAASGVDVRAETERGSLVVTTKTDTYLRDGRFDPDRMIAFLEEQAERMAALGFSALRVTGEMTWALGDAEGTDRLLEYESKVNRFFEGRPALAICQYDRKRFPPSLVKGVIHTHPLVIHGGVVGKNPYFVPPDAFLDGNPDDVEVDRLLANIIGRETMERRLREATVRLAEAEKLAALGTLAAGVAHEIRTPVTYIQNYLNLIRARLEKGGLQEPDMGTLLTYTERSLDGLRRIDRIVTDLRAIYKRQDVGWRVNDLSAPVRRAVDMYRSAKSGRAQIVVDLQPCSGIGYDEGQIVQLVVNLMSNGVEAMPDGGLLMVSTRRLATGAVIAVADEGTGIRDEDKAHLFDPFFTTKPGGSGLGMYLVSRIAARHGGTVKVDSTEGKGTRVEVALPPGVTAPIEVVPAWNGQVFDELQART